jgi:hypothetical protein
MKVLGFAEFHIKMWPKSLSCQLHKWTCSALPQWNMSCLFVVAHTQFAQEATMVKTVVGRDISFEHEA